MKSLIQFELMKLARRRTILFVIFMLNVGPLCYLAMTFPVLRWSAPEFQASFVLFSKAMPEIFILNGIYMIPFCLMMFVSEMWIGEIRNRSFMTLILTQASRWRILLAKVASLLFITLGCHVIFVSLFHLSITLVTLTFPASMTGPLEIDRLAALQNMAKFLGFNMVTLLPVVLFCCLLGLISPSMKRAIVLALVMILTMCYIENRIEEYYEISPDRASWVFLSPYFAAHDRILVAAAFTGSPLNWWNPSTHLQIALANALLFWALTLSLVNRKQFEK